MPTKNYKYLFGADKMPRPKKEIKPQPKAEPVIKVTEEIIEDNKNQITIKVIPPKNEKGLMPCRKCNSYNLGQTYLNDIHEDAMIYCNDCGFTGPFADGYEQANELWNNLWE